MVRLWFEKTEAERHFQLLLLLGRLLIEVFDPKYVVPGKKPLLLFLPIRSCEVFPRGRSRNNICLKHFLSQKAPNRCRREEHDAATQGKGILLQW